jgi:hypothetical protein
MESIGCERSLVQPNAGRVAYPDDADAVERGDERDHRPGREGHAEANWAQIPIRDCSRLSCGSIG